MFNSFSLGTRSQPFAYFVKYTGHFVYITTRRGTFRGNTVHQTGVKMFLLKNKETLLTRRRAYF